MIIPYQQLSSDALAGVIRDFVTRSYEEFGPTETSIEKRQAQVLAQLKSGEAVITFNEEDESVSIAPARSVV